MALLLYLMSHWVLVLVAVLSVVGLGVAAWVFKNWKMALAAIVVAIFGFMYQGAVMHGINLQIANQAAEKIEILEDRIEVMNKAAALHSARAVEDAAKIEELENLANETPANNGACLDIDGARRLRNIK